MSGLHQWYHTWNLKSEPQKKLGVNHNSLHLAQQCNSFTGTSICSRPTTSMVTTAEVTKLAV